MNLKIQAIYPIDQAGRERKTFVFQSSQLFKNVDEARRALRNHEIKRYVLYSVLAVSLLVSIF